MDRGYNTVLAQACMHTTNYHNLGGLDKNIHFSQFWRLGNLRSRCQPTWLLVRILFLCCRQRSCIFTRQKERSHTSSSFDKGINSIMRAPSSGSHLTLISSQRFHLQIPSHWELELQHKILEGTQIVCP